MAVRGGKPPEGGKDRNWQSHTIEKGKSFDGWIAGDAICVRVHPNNYSKPCLTAYRGENANCPGCAARRPVDWLYYVPCYSAETDHPCVIRCHTDQRAALEKIALHEAFTAKKPPEQSVGVQILRKFKAPNYAPTLPCRRLNADISEWLVVLWGYQEFIFGWEVLRGPLGTVDVEPAPGPAPEPAPAPAPAVDADFERAALECSRAQLRNRLSLTGSAEPLGEILPSGNASIRPPYRNGKPK